jgi:hypothetical protein
MIHSLLFHRHKMLHGGQLNGRPRKKGDLGSFWLRSVCQDRYSNLKKKKKNSISHDFPVNATDTILGAAYNRTVDILVPCVWGYGFLSSLWKAVVAPIGHEEATVRRKKETLF